MTRRLAFLALLILLLSACQPNVPAAADTETPLPPTTTAVPATAMPTTNAPPTKPTATPLRLFLPTPPAEPHSIWRPPLYPTPWALGPHDHFYFARPIAADEVNWPLPSYRYGAIFFGPDVPHTGIDIAAKRGTPVLAAGGGTVIWAGWGLYSGNSQDTKDPYGKAVAIRHDFGYNGQTLYTIYGHMDAVHVTRGQHVQVGEQIGLVGDTGFTTGPHLHFEVRLDKNGFFNTLNPELWLVPPEGWGVLAGRIMDTRKSPLRRATLTVTSQKDEHIWQIQTYGSGTIHSDPCYQENMALSDLPAGVYTVRIVYQGHVYSADVTISPGQITYITFQGRYGFQAETPAPSVLTP